MSHNHQSIIDEVARGQCCVIEPFRSPRTSYGMALLADERYFFIPRKEWWDSFVANLMRVSTTFVCFDMRRIMDLPLSQASVVDMKTILGGGETPLLNRAREQLPGSPLVARLAELENQAAANLRAIRTAHVDVGNDFDKTMSADFFTEYLKVRADVIRHLWLDRQNSREVDEWWRRLDFIKAVHEVELGGIRIDRDYVDSQLLKQQDPATAKSLRSMQGLYRDGYVTSLFNVAGTKTGRLRQEGGFNAMGVPHGPARNAIISRFPGGKIYSFDYNAIDYRSIVSTIGGNFAELYRSSRDFHTRTAQFIFKDVDEVRRDAMKAISYTSIYGGSESTLAERTGLSADMIKKVMEMLSEPMRPITEFRETLWGQWQIMGYIDIPGVGRYEKKEDEEMHPGKLLALYAQGYSAYVFESAFTKVHSLLREHSRGSCIIFPVHDELVVDVHPVDEEAGLPMGIVREMESGVAQGFVVNFKKGRSYGEIE